MSPEQARAEKHVDARTDIWSLGAVLYEALSGRPAYPHHGSLMDILTRIACEDPVPLAMVAPWVPDALCDVVHAALTRDREARPSDAAELAREIAQAMPDPRMSLSGVPISTVVATSSASPARPASSVYAAVAAEGNVRAADCAVELLPLPEPEEPFVKNTKRACPGALRNVRSAGRR